MRANLIVLVVLMVSCCLLVGCGGDGSGGIVITAPDVTQTFPADGAIDVSLNTLISVTFSEEMNETSLDSVYVIGVSTHHREYDNSGKKVTLYLADILEPDSSYHVRISSYCMDKGCNNLASDVTFSFTTGPLDCQHLEDELEPNDDFDSAVEIEVDKTYTLLSSCGGTERNDYYTFTLEDSAKVTIRTQLVYGDTSEVRWIVSVLRPDRASYFTYGNPLKDGIDLVYYYSFLPGTYYLHTGKINEDSYLAVYNLTLEISEPCQDDIYEDNDFTTDAPLITPGLIEDLRGCYTDRDYFAIELITGQTLTATVTEVVPSTSYRTIFILDHVGTQRVMESGQSTPLVAVWTAEGDGVHYIQVQWLADGAEYTLKTEVSGP